MPNHVMSKMTLKGDPSVVREFFESHIREEKNWNDEMVPFLDFMTLIPMPVILANAPEQYPETDEMRENRMKYGYASWYQWSIDNWGTKWNSYDGKVKLSDPTVDGVGKGNDLAKPVSELIIEFSTAWSLPEKILNEIVDLYPELEMHLECVEEGGFFAGYIHYVPNQEVEADLSQQQWKFYARKFYGEDWWNEYVADCHEDGRCNEDGSVWFNDDGTIETEFHESEPDEELPAPEVIH